MKAIDDIDFIKLIEVIGVLAKNQTWQIPTLFLYRTFANKTFKKDSWKKNFNSSPFEIREKWLDKISEIAIPEIPDPTTAKSYTFIYYLFLK